MGQGKGDGDAYRGFGEVQIPRKHGGRQEGYPFDKNIFCSYKKPMQYEWDENKRLANLEKHGLDFKDIIRFEWAEAVILIDERKDYGEERFIAYGFCSDRFVALAFTL